MMRRVLPLLLISSAFAIPLPTGPIVTNAADRSSSNIAPGSFISFRLYGGEPFTSPTATITIVASDGATYALAPIVPSTELDKSRPQELWAVIPSNIKTGIALLSAQGEGMQTPIQIVETSPAIFTNAYPKFTGVGYDLWGGSTALALNHPATPIGLTSAAVPGGIVSLFATGLNGATTSDVTVELGGIAIIPLYAGPQGQPGLDQINFIVPQDTVLGCYVPVLIRVRGALSNRTSFPINSDSYACAHPLGISYGELKTLDAGGTIPLGLLAISDPGAAFSVINADARTVAAYAGEQMFPAQRFTCFLGSFWDVGLQSGVRRDAGPAVQLTGPGGPNIPLTGGDTSGSWGYRYTNYVTAAEQPVFAGGAWQVSAPGGADLASFFQSFFLPPVSVSLDVKAGDTIPSTRDLIVTWDGSGFGASDVAKMVLIGGTSNEIATCAVPAWTGRAQLPQSMLARFAGKHADLGLAIVPGPSARTIFPILQKDGSSLRTLIDYTFIASEINVVVQ